MNCSLHSVSSSFWEASTHGHASFNIDDVLDEFAYTLPEPMDSAPALLPPGPYQEASGLDLDFEESDMIMMMACDGGDENEHAAVGEGISHRTTEPPRSPIPSDICIPHTNSSMDKGLSPAMVSPESTPRTVSLTAPPTPNMVELQLEYKRTLKKLAKSMRRSDESRSMVKRQRTSWEQQPFQESQADNFFRSPRCIQLEHSRKEVLKAISNEMIH